MNIEHLRRSLKLKWLQYYQENRSWLVKLAIWVTNDGERRPSSSFILGLMTTLEPQLLDMIPLIVALNKSPDQIVEALGLNFNPDTELKQTLTSLQQLEQKLTVNKPKMLPIGPEPEVNITPKSQATNVNSWIDETCRGSRYNRD